MSVKITELANRVGLDKSTVSRALNGRSGVAPATRQKILQAARELGYRPNIHGQQLRGWKSTILSLVVGMDPAAVSSPFFGSWTLEIFRSAVNRGYDTLIIGRNHHVGESMTAVLNRRASVGAILMGRQPEEVLEDLAHGRMPCVQLGSNYCEGIGIVASDNHTAMCELTTHLLELGHRRLSLVGDPTQMRPFQERHEAFTQALQAAGLSEVVIDDVGRADEERYVRQLLISPQRPTAIVCVNDERSARVWRIAEKLGLGVPRDLSLTGFGDIDRPLVEQLGLTTIRVNFAALADAAVEMVLRLDGDEINQTQRRLPAQLILRSSTAPPGLKKT